MADPDPLDIDWCARAVKLSQVEMALISGEMVTEARFGSDMMRYANASLQDVQWALREAKAQCMLARGLKPARTRFAKRGVMRLY
ncbi:hypothetical protein [Rhizobium halophytocola]|uniref:Uncharacterized protein n=1 Tax=Rhizobium halophytocola TaxID=735519 RepID=A0ABS4E2G7_9HYPH|nr:hypothetical protein [Rhizobium halophytocola]MBP1852128.1 hypothetical protein [Rhizobium halophytocola]